VHCEADGQETLLIVCARFWSTDIGPDHAGKANAADGAPNITSAATSVKNGPTTIACKHLLRCANPRPKLI